MTTLQTSFPTTDGDSDQHDAETKPRFSDDAFLLSLRDASQSLNRIAEHLSNGKRTEPPVDHHEETCLEIESVASGGDPGQDEIETMADIQLRENDEPDERSGIEGLQFYGSLIKVCVDLGYRWKAPGPYTNLPLRIGGIPSVTAARQVAVAKNRYAIRKKRISRAVVIKQRGNGKYGVKMLSTGIPINSKNPFDDHPAVQFAPMNYQDDLEKCIELNKAAIKTMHYHRTDRVRRWHVIVVPIRPFQA